MAGVPPPRTGPCESWVSGPTVAGLPAVTAAADEQSVAPEQLAEVCAEAAMAASDILYRASGQQFTGQCGPVTIRPLARPTDEDSRLAWFGGLGYNTSWGYAAFYDQVPGVASMYGSINPPEIDLGAYPVTEIVQVLIDGVLIPAIEYELRDFRKLIRMRPTASSTPTERWGWPTGQVQDLPDTQKGTFSVTYRYGSPPPASGRLAALKLAEYLVLPQLGDTTRYPDRTTSITRQGVTAQVASVTDLLKAGSLGIYEVDLFLMSVNPHKLRRRSGVFSPDTGRPRRAQSPSVSGGA